MLFTVVPSGSSERSTLALTCCRLVCPPLFEETLMLVAGVSPPIHRVLVFLLRGSEDRTMGMVVVVVPGALPCWPLTHGLP